MREGERAVILCVGEAGRGKTYTLRQLIRRTPRVLIADATGDFRDESAHTFTRAAECARAVAWRVRHRFPDSPARSAELEYLPFRYRLALDLDGAAHAAYATGSAGPVEQLGPRVATIGYAARCCAVVLDELRLWCSPSFIPPVLALLMGTGRHRGVSFLATTRRPAEVHRLVTSQADLVIAFQTVEPLDLVYLRGRFGDAVDRLPSLPPRHALAVGDPACLRIIGASRLPANIQLLDRALARGAIMPSHA